MSGKYKKKLQKTRQNTKLTPDRQTNKGKEIQHHRAILVCELNENEDVAFLKQLYNATFIDKLYNANSIS